MKVIGDARPESKVSPKGDCTSEGRVKSVQTFSEVYHENVRYVWSALRRLGVRSAENEDACQDVFVVVHGKLHTFDWDRPIRPWLLGICLRVAAKYRRKAHNTKETIMEAPTLIEPEVQSRTIETRQARELLEHILDQLSGDQREVFVLYELQELPMANVSSLLDIPLQTAYSRLHSARKKVNQHIQRIQMKLEGGNHGP